MCDKTPEGIFEKKVARGQMVKIMDEIWQEEYKQVYEDLRFRTRSMWILLPIYLIKKKVIKKVKLIRGG